MLELYLEVRHDLSLHRPFQLITHSSPTIRHYVIRVGGKAELSKREICQSVNIFTKYSDR
jgi:hypothetical protein